MQFHYIGRTRTPLAYASEHKHIGWELIYNISGAGTMEIEGKQYPFSAGSVLLCPPGMRHSKQSEDTFEDFYVTFSDSNLDYQVYTLEDQGELQILPILQILHTLFYQGSSKSVCGALFDALMHILKPQLQETVTDKYVQILRRAIVDSFTDPDFNLEETCGRIPQNIDYLRRNFKRIVGVTPHRYLTRLRMENAKHILDESPEMKVYIREVALRSGFSDPLYFSKLFKKETGVSPSQWQGSEAKK